MEGAVERDKKKACKYRRKKLGPLSSPRLKGYSPGFTTGSGEAVADADASKLEPLVEGRDGFIFGWGASSQRQMKESDLMICFTEEYWYVLGKLPDSELTLFEGIVA